MVCFGSTLNLRNKTAWGEGSITVTNCVLCTGSARGSGSQAPVRVSDGVDKKVRIRGGGHRVRTSLTVQFSG